MATADRLLELYRRMYDRLGPQGWWPGDSPFEVMVGAILTQNTSWKNVERAIDNLKGAGLLAPDKLVDLPTGLLAEYIRPAGYYNIKAGRLHNLLGAIDRSHQGDLETFLGQPLPDLRQQLLAVKGIGPETADSILLYALDLPSFVVDAYTRRILTRHGLVPEDIGYEELREFFMDALPPDVRLFNEYHALIVRTGKGWCAKKAGKCQSCPLACFLE